MDEDDWVTYLNSALANHTIAIHHDGRRLHCRPFGDGEAQPGIEGPMASASPPVRATQSSAAVVTRAGASAAGAAAVAVAAVKPESVPHERAFCAEDDETLTARQHMLAGAAAGMTEHMVMFPVDTVKTRMQSYTGVRDHAASGVFRAARAIAASEGGAALWRGVGAVAISAGPAHALYFAAYEAARARLDARGGVWRAVAPATAGAVATVIMDAVMTPLDVVKQRMQLSATTRYDSVLSCARAVYRTHGVSAFFAGYRATLVMNIPFTAVYFSAYESAKSMLLQRTRHADGDRPQFSAASHCIAGGIAGGAAAAATNPLDVVKTRLQTQGEVGARRYRGLMHALNDMRVEEGARGFMRGIKARMLFHVPAAAVCWTTYEFCKHLMNSDN